MVSDFVIIQIDFVITVSLQSQKIIISKLVFINEFLVMNKG